LEGRAPGFTSRARESDPNADRFVARQQVPFGPGKKSGRPGLVSLGLRRFGRRGTDALTHRLLLRSSGGV